MTEQIIITIDPAPDGVRCGECCRCFFDDCPPGYVSTREAQRGPLCLAAEARFRALVEAGEAMRQSDLNDCNPAYKAAWDRAVKEAGE